jgi:integrase
VSAGPACSAGGRVTPPPTGAKTITIGKHRGRPAFRWYVNRKPQYRVIERPDDPKTTERQRQELLAEFIAGPTIKTKSQNIDETIDEFIAILRAKCSDRYADESEKRIRRIPVAGKIKQLDAITGDKVELAMAGMKRSNYDTRPLSEQSKNHIRASVRQFCRWCLKNRYMREQIDIRLPKVRTKPGQRDRFQPEEAASLITTAQNSTKELQFYSGPLRAWLYRLAITTGLRRNELAALTPECFDLTEGAIRVAASYTKNGKTAVCPIPARAVPELSRWLAEHEPSQPVVSCLRMKRVREFVRFDMAAAGLPVRTAWAPGRSIACGIRLFPRCGTRGCRGR